MTHWGPRFGDDHKCKRHGEMGCPSCLAYALGDANAKLADTEAAFAQLSRAANSGSDKLRAAQARAAEMERALRDAVEGLRASWQMLSAVFDGDPSTDRRKARDAAAAAMNAANRALLSPSARPAAEDAESQPRDPSRCTLCGAPRIYDPKDREWGACSLVPGRDGKGGCPDPLHDYRVEHPDPAPSPTDGAWCDGGVWDDDMGRIVPEPCPACARPGEKGTEP